MGIPLGTIIYDIGGGIPNNKKLKAVQIGGPSGGCIPIEHLNTKVDYESLKELGAIMGSGGLIVWMKKPVWLILLAISWNLFRKSLVVNALPVERVPVLCSIYLLKICQGQEQWKI
jgi:NADH-quinone oxidoreductase subunit F